MPAENRPEARRLLEARAMAALEGGELASLSRQRIRLWEYPAFADYSSWIVQDAGAGGSAPETYTAHQIVWNMTHDLLRFADPLEGIRQGFYTPPTISIRTALIPANSLSPALQDVLSVRFPDANVATGVTLDGLEFGIELANISQTLRAVWNTEGPDEWQLFITIVGRLREMLRQLFG